jgi:hypothetical protein
MMMLSTDACARRQHCTSTQGGEKTYVGPRNEDVEAEDEDEVVERCLCAPARPAPALGARVQLEVAQRPEDAAAGMSAPLLR